MARCPSVAAMQTVSSHTQDFAGKKKACHLDAPKFG
jgi:hypothetical protein